MTRHGWSESSNLKEAPNMASIYMRKAAEWPQSNVMNKNRWRFPISRVKTQTSTQDS